MASGVYNVKLGLRVVRGPDWCYHDTYPEGLVGTVVEIGGQGESTAPERSVRVIWDSGDKVYYRAGYGNAFDLHTFDTIQCRVKHEFVTCDGCGEQGITGFRWQCSICDGIDLCSWCYMSDKHDITHIFVRYETELSVGFRVPPRSDSQDDKRLSCGIFKGASVSRGPDWDFCDQDGGPGNSGQVIKISSYGSILVKWNSGNEYSYRVGSSGKVDLKLLNMCYGIFYYKSHLPLLGKFSDLTIKKNFVQRPYRSVERRKSYVNHDNSEATDRKRMPFYHVENMRRRNKDVNSQRDESAKNREGANSNESSQTLENDLEENEEESYKKPSREKNSCFEIGEKVRIAVEFSSAKRLQEGHGGFPKNMIPLLNKIGTIFSIKENGDVTVKFGDSGPYQFNPKVLSKMRSDSNLTEQKMPEKNNIPSARGNAACSLCLAQNECAAFIPCGHIVSCLKCSKMFARCPRCEKDVEGQLLVYLP